MACPTLYIHLGTSRPSRTATARRIYKNTVKDKVRPAIIKNPRLERKKFIILTSTLTIYPVIQDMTKTLLLPYRQGDCLKPYTKKEVISQQKREEKEKLILAVKEYYHENGNISETARKFKLSRNTVRKYINLKLN